MTIFVGTNGNQIATSIPVAFVGWTTGVVANVLDLIGDTYIALGGNDRVVAGNGNDVILGGDGNDFIDGRLGFDVMDGGTGFDTMDVSWFAATYVWDMTTGVTNFSAGGEFAFNFEGAITGAGNDRITGSLASNSIRTNGGNDFLDGQAGNDFLSGGAGLDVMAGGLGNDVFVFNTTLNALTNTDRITDFNTLTDTIDIDNAVFVGLAVGALNALAFRVGLAAFDFDDRIIYNALSGDIFFDANGVLAGGSTRFAHVNPGTVVTAADFFVI